MIWYLIINKSHDLVKHAGCICVLEIRTGLGFTSFFLYFPKDAQAWGHISWQGEVSVWWELIDYLVVHYFISWYRGTVSSLHADPVVTHLGFQLCEPYINPNLRNLTLRNLFLFQIVLCMWTFCLFVYMCTMCVPSAQGGQKRVLDTLGLELCVIVSYYVDAGNWTFPL